MHYKIEFYRNGIWTSDSDMPDNDPTFASEAEAEEVAAELTEMFECDPAEIRVVEYDPASDGPFEVQSCGDEVTLDVFDDFDEAKTYAEERAYEYHYGTQIVNASGWVDSGEACGFEAPTV